MKMDRMTLDRLLTDGSLNELDADVRCLLDAYLEKDPNARVEAGISLAQCVLWDGARATANARRTVITPESLLLVPDQADPAAAPR